MKQSTLLFTIILSMASFSASATILYGTSKAGGPLSDLYVVDSVTGTTTLIGNIGYAVNGLEAYDGRIWGTTSSNDPSFHGLIEINPATGIGTQVGSGWPHDIVEFAFDSIGNAYAFNESNGDILVTIDLIAGSYSDATNSSGISSYEHGIAFDLSDILYIVNSDENILTINTVTGVATITKSGHGFHAHHGDVNPDSGLYYGLGYSFGDKDKLRIVDLTSGTLQSTVNLDRDLHTLAWTESTPAISASAGGWLLSLCLIGFIGMRKKSGKYA